MAKNAFTKTGIALLASSSSIEAGDGSVVLDRGKNTILNKILKAAGLSLGALGILVALTRGDIIEKVFNNENPQKIADASKEK